MKKFLMVLVSLVLFFVVSGRSGISRQVMKVPETIQRSGTQESKKECVDTDYKSDGGVFIKVICLGRIIHVVNKLKPDTDYAILIGNDPIVIAKSSPEGIIVFVNQFGNDVELIPGMPDEELKKIRVKQGGE